MAELLRRLRWRLKMIRAALTIKRVAGGSPEGEGEGSGSGEGSGGDADGSGAGDADGSETRVESDDDWKTKSRKNEAAAKRERKAREEAERKLAERDQANQTDHENEVEQAKKEAREEALNESQAERRADRLEVAVTRHAAKGIKVGDDTVRFADAEDALLHVERGIRNGDIDEDEIFDGEGRVQTTALTTALGELLERKPHLKAGAENGRRPAGDADGGKGSGSGEANVAPGISRLRHAYSDN